MNDDRHEPPSGRQIELARGEQRATVVEVGGALRAYSVADWDVFDGYAETEMCSGARGQPLIPWPNRLRDGRFEFDGREHQLPLSEPERHNAIHGLVRWANWRVGERSDARVTMHHVLHPQPGYPFTVALEIEYTLGDDGLAVRTTATNTGSGRCPYGAGTHPYITVGSPTIDDDLLQAPGTHWMPTDEQAIPTGLEPVEGTPYDFRELRAVHDTQLDTGYAELARGEDGLAHVRLRGPDGRQVGLWLDEGYGYLMLFTGDSLPDHARRRRSLGVEPMTCAPNALQTGEGLRVLAPSESFSAAWGIRPRAAERRESA